MSDLKPCPFCGGEARIGKIYGDAWTVECTECGIQSGCYDTEAEAIEAWNHRVATDTNVGSKVAKVLNQERISRYAFGECGACGAPVVKPDKYCSECGAKLEWSDKVIRQTIEKMKAESERKWIPVTEALPEEEKDVLVSVHFDGYKDKYTNYPPSDYVEIASHLDGVWSSTYDDFKVMRRHHHIVAWMPTPEPYRGDE